MKKKSYKQKYEDLLSKREVDEKIVSHTKSYNHICLGDIGRFFVLLGSIGLTILNFFLISYTWKLLNLGNLNEENLIGFNHLLILYPLIGEYILIGLSAICFVAFIKGGFNKLKSIKDDGLIIGLIIGLSDEFRRI